MKLSVVAVMLAGILLTCGCAGPGVLHSLPDPVFGPYARPPAPRPAAPAPTPEPKTYQPPGPTLGPVTIVVDAGHGGRDPGALGVGTHAEKTVNLLIAGRLAELLQAAGATVISTRQTDRFIALDERAAVAEYTHADLFISIHSDACDTPSVSGATVYIARNALPASRRAAQCVADALQQAGIEFRGIRRAGFRVLVGHSRPSMLIECGFLTNGAEAALLCSNSYQQKVAAAIARGVATYFNE